MSGASVRSDGFDDLDRTLRDLRGRAIDEGRQIVSKGSLNIKNGAQRRIRDAHIAHAPLYSYTINYDVWVTGQVIRSEVGPDKTKQVGGGPHRTPGNLGHIFEYGIPGTPPRPHLAPALADELPNFERYVGDLGERLLS